MRATERSLKSEEKATWSWALMLVQALILTKKDPARPSAGALADA